MFLHHKLVHVWGLQQHAVSKGQAHGPMEHSRTDPSVKRKTAWATQCMGQYLTEMCVCEKSDPYLTPHIQLNSKQLKLRKQELNFFFLRKTRQIKFTILGIGGIQDKTHPKEKDGICCHEARCPKHS